MNSLNPKIPEGMHLIIFNLTPHQVIILKIN